MMEEFLCCEMYGPHHGVYICKNHMTYEFWLYGELKRWVALGVTYFESIKER